MADEEIRKTPSGIPIREVYGPKDLQGFDPSRDLGEPGHFPFTRGVYPGMYRRRLWTMRQYAGFGSARETNERFRYLLSLGQTGLSLAFDLPTQLGYDSDHPMAEGEVGRTGVAVSTLEDLDLVFQGIPLGQVSTSMTINATAAILLGMYVLIAEKQGTDPQTLRGTVQNDILKEFVARGNYIYPVQPSMRLVGDVIEFCAHHLPKWNPISISGYHYREAGATAVQEVAFTLADGIAYVEEVQRRGLDVDAFAPRLSFFFAAHSYFFEEIAKFRAARRIWAHIMRDRFHAKNEKSWRLRFHTQTGGVTLTATEPLNNLIRVAYQALSAVLGGTQSLHTNAYDEALALPTDTSAKLALRTQQILAYETGVPDTVDPLAGSYFVESLTNQMEERIWELLEEIDRRGGAVAAIESGFFQEQIAQSAYEAQKKFEQGETTVVGVNRFQEETQEPQVQEILKVDPEIEREQIERLRVYKDNRDRRAVTRALQELRHKAQTAENLVPTILEALRNGATLGEISDALREVFGEYREA